MQRLVKLILPEKTEIFLFLSLGLALLLLSNVQRLWNFLSGGVDFNRVGHIDEYAVVAQGKLFGIENSIDPRFADFTVWLIVGFVTIVFILLSQAILERVNSEKEDVSRISNKKQHNLEIEQYALRVMLRVAGVVTLVLWTRLFFGIIFPQLSMTFFLAATDITYWLSWAEIVYSIVMTGVSLYVFIVCLRLSTQKIRLFR